MVTKTPTKYFNANRDKICKFCNLGFSSEKTLSAHMCPKKRRMAEKDTTTSRIAFQSFLTFHEMVMHSQRKHTFDEFISSSYYAGFIKLARFIVSLKPISSDAYVSYLFKNGIKINKWCDMDIYFKFVADYLPNENPTTAVERSLGELDEWAENNRQAIQDYFELVSTVEAVYSIRRGKISPWLLYLSPKAGLLLERFAPEQAEEIMPFINPTKWAEVFEKKQYDVEFFKPIIEESGL